MSVYVDPLIATKPYYKSANERWNWGQSCHMTADTETELHAFAAQLGLKREWFQKKHHNPAFWHYDLTANKRRQAVRLGAIELTWEQVAEHIAQAKKQETPESEAGV